MSDDGVKLEGGHTAALRVALAWLGHPVSVVGLALLLLNDHVLKAEYGTWWTGKLSDVAGLVFAPALVAVVVAALAPRLRPRVVAAASLATIGLLFTLVKATAIGATTASAVWTAIAGPSVVLQDATDLLALPALALAWWAFTRAHRRPAPAPTETGRTLARARVLILVPVATLAVAATSQAEDSLPHAMDVHVEGTLVAVAVTHGESWGAPPVVWFGIDIVVDSQGNSTWELKVNLPQDDLEALRLDGATGVKHICVPDDQAVCYRVDASEPAIDESADGGETWSRVWGLTENQRARLDEMDADYWGLRGVTEGAIAVVPIEGRYVVVAATGADGVTVRNLDGTWERIGMPAYGPAYDLPDTPRLARAYVSPFPLGLVVGGMACLLVLAVAARSRPWNSNAIAVATIPLLISGLFMAITVAGNIVLEFPEKDLSFDGAIQSRALWLMVGLGLVGVFALRAFDARRGWIAVGAALGAGIVTGSASVSSVDSVEWTAAAAAVWVAATIGAVVAVRRIPIPPEVWEKWSRETLGSALGVGETPEVAEQRSRGASCLYSFARVMLAAFLVFIALPWVMMILIGVLIP